MQFLDSTQPQQRPFIGIQPTLFDGLLLTPKIKPTPKIQPTKALKSAFLPTYALTQSPLNYTGSKFRLLPQLLPLKKYSNFSHFKNKLAKFNHHCCKISQRKDTKCQKI